MPADEWSAPEAVDTASGAFVLSGDDFVVPPRLAALGWIRSYRSPRAGDPGGPFGRGWWTLAQVRLVPGAGGTLDYAGPDGHRVSLAPGQARAAGLAAELDPAGDGWALRWDATASWPPQRWGFDGTGRLVEISGPHTGVTTLIHAGGRLAGLDHEGGRSLRLAWDGDHVVAASLSDGRQVRYAYDGAGDLVAVTGGAGGQRFEVDGAGRITAVVDADGVRVIANAYDGEGRVVTQTSATGHRTRFEYGPGRTTAVTACGELTTRYRHDERGRIVEVVGGDGRRVERYFAPDGRLARARHPDGSIEHRFRDPGAAGAEVVERRGADGSVHRWLHDGRGRLVRHEHPGGRVVTYEYRREEPHVRAIRGPLGWRLDLEWEGGALAAVTDADGVRTELGHDADGCLVAISRGAGAPTRIEPHPTGRPAVIRYPDGAVARLGWDGAGRPVELVDTAGAVTRFERTAAGRLVAVTDPLGHRTRIVYGADGLADAVVDPLGNPVRFRHDEHGRLVALVDATGAGWGIDWSPAGRPARVEGPDGSAWVAIREPGGRLTELIDPLGRTERRHYDGAGRLVARRDAAGSEQRLGYDGLGRVVLDLDGADAAARLDWDALDRLVTVTDPDGVVQRREYTPAGRLAAITDGAGATTRFEHDGAGRLVAQVLPSGNHRVYGHDERDRVVTETSPAGRVGTYGHDESGRPASVTVGGSRWELTHDAAGRVVAATDPVGGVTRWAHDAAGRVIARTGPPGDERGAVTRFVYDPVGSLVEIVDALDRPVAVTHDALRRPVSVRDQLGRLTTYRYDTLGRLIGWTPAGGEAVQLDRDHRGAVTVVRAGGAELVRAERDGAGRATAICEPGLGRTQLFTWSPGGRLAAWTDGTSHLRWARDGAGRVSRRQGLGDDQLLAHDPDGHLVALVSRHTGKVRLRREADGLLVALEAAGLRRWWRYDTRGWLVEHAEQLGSEIPRANRLGRDAAGRVVEITGPHGEQTAITYDAAGRLVRARGAGGDNRRSYDAAGRLVAEGGPGFRRRYRYDRAHQLVALDGDDGRVTYAHDAGGRRTAEHGPMGARRFDYDALGRLRRIIHDGRGDAGRVTAVRVDPLGLLVDAAGVPVVWDLARRGTPAVRVGDHLVVSAAGEMVAVAAATPGGDGGDRSVTWVGAGWPGVAAAALTERSGAPVRVGAAGDVEIDGLVWRGRRLHDPAVTQPVTPPGHLLLVDPPARPPSAMGRTAPATGAIVPPPSGAGTGAVIARAAAGAVADPVLAAVAAGAAAGHWDAVAIVRAVATTALGAGACAAYDLTGLPGADTSLDLSAVAEALLTGEPPARHERRHLVVPEPAPRPAPGGIPHHQRLAGSPLTDVRGAALPDVMGMFPPAPELGTAAFRG